MESLNFHELNLHERLRAWADGKLPPDDRARFERELAADPALAARAEEFREVWAATEVLAAFTPVSRSTWDDVVRRGQARERVFRRRVAAAALVLLLPAAWLTWRAVRSANAEPERVVVESFPLTPTEQHVPTHAPVPATLANYAPVANASIQWLTSFEDARGVAEAVNRPLLVFGFVPGCPWCKELRENQFKDARFLALAERTVPVEIDLLALGEPKMLEIMNRGYPLIELQTPLGEPLHVMSGPPGEVDLPVELARGLDGWPTEPPALAWSTANEMARIFAQSVTSERQGRLSDALHGFDTLRNHLPSSTLTLEGELGHARIEQLARDLLDTARTRASTEPDAARAEFEAALAHFAGTPYENDLKHVLDTWRLTNRFPTVTSKRS